MNNKLLISKALALGLMLFIGGCGQGPEGGRQALVTEDDVVLVEVDGAPVTLPMLEFLMQVRGVDEDDTAGMRELLDELIRLRAVANRAADAQISSRQRVRAERMVKDIEVQYVRYLEYFQRENPVTEEEIRSVYEAQLERAGEQRYKIETIEFPEQAAALAQLEALQTGEMTFEQAVEQASTEGRIARRTDWVDASQVPADFAGILASTEAGAVVDSLLPYQDKWLVVRTVEVDALAPPSLEEVRKGIRRTLVRQQTQAMIERTFERSEILPMLPLDDARVESSDNAPGASR